MDLQQYRNVAEEQSVSHADAPSRHFWEVIKDNYDLLIARAEGEVTISPIRALHPVVDDLHARVKALEDSPKQPLVSFGNKPSMVDNAAMENVQRRLKALEATPSVAHASEPPADLEGAIASLQDRMRALEAEEEAVKQSWWSRLTGRNA